jgi:hypothetical protein
MADALRLWLLALVPGRAVLACLPPSAIGSLRPRGIAATLAACTVLGVATSWPQHLAWYWLEWPLPNGCAGIALWLAPWAMLAGLKLILGPGALVPRHEPNAPAAWELGASALALLAVVVQLAAWTGSADRVAAAAFAGIAFALHWRVRADRRALVLAAVAFGLAAGTRQASGWTGLLGLAALVGATPAPARARAAAWALGALLLVGVPLAWSQIDAGHRDRWWGIEFSAR